MDKKKLAKKVCDAITTGGIALKVFRLINEYDGWPPSITKKGSVYIVKFSCMDSEIFDEKEFIEFVRERILGSYESEAIYEVGDVFDLNYRNNDDDPCFHARVSKLLKIK
jgi:hypothetical protein